MPMYNLIEYSKNYRKTTGILWNYYRDELTDDRNNNSFPNKDVINSDSEVEIAVPLKYPSNFWKWKMKKSQTYQAMLIMNLQNLQQESGMLSIIKIQQIMVKEMKIVQPLI